MDLAEGFMGRVLRSNQPIAQTVARDDPARGGLPASHPPIQSLLGAPVRSQSGTAGVVYFADKISGAAFNEEDLQFAATLAAQLALAYGNLRLFEDLQRHAGELQVEIIERKRILEDLRESEMRFRQLAENIDSVFFLVDAESNRTLYVSPSYETVWGLSCESLIADPAAWATVVYPDDRARVLASDERPARNAGFEHEYRIVRRDGACRWIWMRGIPIYNNEGVVCRIAAAAEDITGVHPPAKPRF